MELECKKDELRELIDMIDSEDTVNRVGKYLKRMLMRDDRHAVPSQQYLHHRGTEETSGRGRGGFSDGTGLHNGRSKSTFS